MALPDNGTIERKMEIATYEALKEFLIKVLQDPDARASDIETVSDEVIRVKKAFERLERNE